MTRKDKKLENYSCQELREAILTEGNEQPEEGSKKAPLLIQLRRIRGEADPAGVDAGGRVAPAGPPNARKRRRGSAGDNEGSMGDSDDDELGEGGMRDERRRDTGLFENDGGDSDDGLLMDSGNRGRASSARGGSAGNNSAGSARRGRGGHTPVEHEEDDDDDLSLQQGSTAQAHMPLLYSLSLALPLSLFFSLLSSLFSLLSTSLLTRTA